MRLNRISLNTISLNRIGLNRIGFPSRGSSSSSERPYIDPEVLASLKAVCICYGKSNDDEDRAIIKNLVDPDNPFICSNFSWKLNSGYGKYDYDYSNVSDFVIDKNVAKAISDHKVEIFSAKTSISFSYKSPIYKGKIKITGVTKAIANNEIRYFSIYPNTSTDERIYIYEDGIYNIDIEGIEGGATSVYFFALSNGNTQINLSSNIYVEQVPSYQGALVTDGQDDIIRSTKTVEEMLEGSTECTVVSMVVNLDSRLSISSNVLGSRSLRNQISANKEDKYGIFGYTSSDINSVGNISLINNILGDKEDYIASYPNAGGVQDYFFIDGYLTTDDSPSDCRMKAIFGILISNKVLTSDQINQAIAYFNLDRCVGPLMYLNTIKQGITNENHASFNDELTDFSGNGHNLKIYNTAWNKESGINDDGAWITDGVSDYGKVDNLPILKDYTVFAGREVIDNDIQNADGGVATRGANTDGGAFCFDYKSQAVSFGGFTDKEIDVNSSISYQSKYVNNGIAIEAGTITDANPLLIAKLGTSNERYSKIALSSFLLFPYSLSEFLLERQLKRYKIGTLYPGMVEFRPIVKSNAEYQKIVYYDANWDVINVGDYVSIGGGINANIYLNDFDKLLDVQSNSFNDIEFKYVTGNIYDIIFKGITKSPQRISVILDLYTVQDLLDKGYAIIETRNSRNILRIKQAREDKTLPRISDWDTWIIDKGYVPSFEGLDATSDTWSYLLSLIKDYTYIGSSVWYGGGEAHGAFRQAVGLNGLNVEINIDLHDERYLNLQGAFYQCTASYVTLNLKGEGNISVMQSCFAGTPNLSKVVLNPIDNPDLVIYPQDNSAILDWCNCVDGDPLPSTGFRLTRNCAYCYQNTPVETINVVWDDVNILLFAFKNCSNLVNVTNEIPISSDATEVPVIDAFTNCPNLTDIRLKGIVRGNEEADYTWDFSGCSKLSKESIQYMLENARSNADITGIINYNGACKSYFENGDISEDIIQTFIGKNWKIQIDGVDYLPSYLTSLSNTTLISNETLIKNE